MPRAAHGADERTAREVHDDDGMAVCAHATFRRGTERPAVNGPFEAWSVWLQFALCVAAIAWGGTKLTHYGDRIAAATGMGGGWIGLILLGTVTSLPELVTGMSSVAIADAPDIAAGDVLGSCVFNLLLVGVMDVLYRGGSIYTRAGMGHIISAGFGVVLLGVVAFTLVTAPNLEGVGRGFHIGAESFVILILYLAAVRTVYRYECREIALRAEVSVPPAPLRMLLARYALWSMPVVAAAMWLPFVGERIVELTGLGRSFVGNLLIAFATSTPEIAVTVASVRTGTIDLAIGNLLGSNLFNMGILALDDIVYRRDALLRVVEPAHAASAAMAATMSGVVIVALLYRPESRTFRVVGWAGMVLLVLYLLNAYVLYLGSR